MADEADERGRRGFLPHFDIVKPSLNYHRNSATFSYRLSELVFGSLLASYILGFLGFIITYVQPFQVPKPGDAVLLISVTGFLKLSSFVDVVIISQYLINSLMFATYTALVYFNYHQSILYISTNLQRASSDFLIAILIGVFFGLSMLLPMLVLLFLGCLILMVLNKKRRLLEPYLAHFADKAGLVPSASDPQYASELDRARRKIKMALKSKPNPVLDSWSQVGGTMVWVGALTMIGLSLFVFVLTNLVEPTAAFLQKQLANGALPAINLFLCVCVTASLYHALRTASWIMPTRDHGGGDQLDKDLDDALSSLKASESNVMRDSSATSQ